MVDIDQLKRIMKITGAPTEDVLAKIESEEVSNCKVIVEVSLTCKHVMEAYHTFAQSWYYFFKSYF